MNVEDRKALDGYLDEIVEREKQRKELADEVKEIIEKATAFGLLKKTVKQLAKERGMNEVERLEQKLFEQQLDEWRAALGMLADTPLGEASEPTYSATNPKYKARSGRQEAHANAN